MQKLVTGISSEPLTEREAEVLQMLATARAIRKSARSFSLVNPP
jgi:hypothetical protein